MHTPRTILIVGGGTAGWMAANALIEAWPSAHITLIESDDIGTIGVGEGSTPYLRHFMQRIGCQEDAWMNACDATFKTGISFVDWSRTPDATQYFHPFFSPVDVKPASGFFHNCHLRRRGKAADARPDPFFLSWHLCQQQRRPTAAPALGVDSDYGYHFDAGKLAVVLRQQAIRKGLQHKRGTVRQVFIHPNGDIAAVDTEQYGRLAADFFIDCTGFSSLLLGKTLAVPYHDYSHQLLNNAAVALPSEALNASNRYPQTRSVALSAGWMWQIPLTHRTGNGYVYSQAFLSADEAEYELRKALGASVNEQAEARHLRMRVGRHEAHWHQNCLAVGLSQGFIEPLEATALMLVQFTLEKFIETAVNPLAQAKFNATINHLFDGVRDYIVGHYVLNNRHGEAYWDAARSVSLPPVLARLMECWDSAEDFDACLHQLAPSLVYLRPSWYCLLAGMGRFPAITEQGDAAPVAPVNAYFNDIVQRYFQQMA